VNHLRELLSVDECDIVCPAKISVQLAKQLHDSVRGLAESAVCFELGWSTTELADPDRDAPFLVNLPFRTCWFEINGSNNHNEIDIIGILVNQEYPSEYVRLFLYTRQDKTWAIHGALGVVKLSSNLGECYPDTDSSTRLLLSCLFYVRRFLFAMNCTNVGRKEHKPDTALQKARAKRGKQPLFSYWTLELNGRDGGAAQSFGGTHASPRVHLRRGHPRQYAPGKWTWVQPHAVGNRELGMVHKDYVVGPQLVVH
jgi:hypothetical protein